MDGNAIPVKENATVIVKCSGDLFLSGVEQSEVRFQSGEDRIRVSQTNDNVYVETHASLDLIVPRRSNLIIERVGGSAFIEDLEGTLTVQKVGGDLAMRRLASVRMEKNGGNCMAEDVSGELSIGKVGGDLRVRGVGGGIQVGMAGGDLDLVIHGVGVTDGRAGGDAQVYFTEGLGERVAVKAGGDVALYLPTSVNGSFALVSGGETIQIHLVNGEQKIDEGVESRHHEFTLGEGGAKIEVMAGGDIRVADEYEEPQSISEDLDRREDAWKEARERHGQVPWSSGFGFDRSSAWADMISRRAQEAARRAEQRASAATRRTEDQIRQAAERELRRVEWQFRGGMPPVPPTPPPPAAEPVTEKERLMILQLLQDGKITVEQAEILLSAIEGKRR